MSYWQAIKESNRPLFLPDIGTYFNQDIECAKKLIDDLAQAGISTIKGEILQTADICLDANQCGNEKYFGQKSNRFVEENYRSLIERKVVSLSAYKIIFDYAKKKNLAIIVSVYDIEGANFACYIGCKAIKIASSNITHQALIEHVASLKKPMIFDTGHSTIEEAARAVNWAKDKNPELDALIEHSPKGPPNPVSQQNLNFMKTLATAVACPFGLSDHHSGEEMLYAATAMGALLLEKGVCPDNMGDEQDGGHAMPVSQVAEVLLKINNIADAMGDGQRHLPRNREKYISRMGLVAKTDLKQNSKLTLETVNFAFPALGIKAEYWSEVEGRVLKQAIKTGQVITWSDLA